MSAPPEKTRQLAIELRLLWLLDKVRRKQVGYSRAAELAQMSVAEFMEKMAEQGISPWEYEPDQVARGVEALEGLLGRSSSSTPAP